MASRRCLTILTRHSISLKSLSSHLQRLPQTLPPQFNYPHSSPLRNFSSHTQNPKHPKFIDDQNHNNNTDDDDEDDDDDEEEEEDEEEEDYTSEDEKPMTNEPSNLADRSYFVEDKIEEAAHIGYKVIGPLLPDERVFKRYEPAFAVVQVGSHQFKVSNGDCIYVEKLKYCEVNDKLILNKVLMAGTPTETMIGRPILPDLAVHAVVEEHALDAKVIIFKKKRRKNYRRTKGHRQELTRLRITNIEGIKKPKTPPAGKMPKTPPAEQTPKTSVKKEEKVTVAA